VNEAELRVRWEERLSTADKGVLDKLWQDLTEQYSDYIDDALRDSRLIADLVDLAEDRIEYWRLGSQHGKPPGRATQTIVEVDLDYYEKECAETSSLYLAKKVASLPEVKRFRQERFGGKLLTTEEAKEFLKGEALSDLSNSDWEYKDLYISWLNDQSAEELAAHVVPSGHKGIISEEDQIFPYSSRGATGVVGSRHKLDYGGLILYLAAIFPWAPYQAGWFLLTGERPEVVPLRFSYHRSRQVFTLSFAPWISEKTIRKAYRRGQKVVQGGDNRRMKERTLAVMRFVTEHTDEEGRRLLSWAQLTDLWNEQHPGEWWFKDRFGLRKAYLRAEKELTSPWH
jgi:hypothetical protein